MPVSHKNIEMGIGLVPKFIISSVNAMRMICSTVVSFPRIEGDISRAPVIIYMLRLPAMRITSLLITIMVSHLGIHPRIERVIKEETRSALSATGSSRAPKLVFWFFILARRPSKMSVTPAATKMARE